MPVRGERQPTPVGAEDRVEIVRFMKRDRPGNAANAIDGPDIPQVTESNLFAVRRNIRRPSEANRLLIGTGSCEIGMNGQKWNNRQK